MYLHTWKLLLHRWSLLWWEFPYLMSCLETIILTLTEWNQLLVTTSWNMASKQRARYVCKPLLISLESTYMIWDNTRVSNTGLLCNKGYTSETQLNPNFAKSGLPITYFLIIQTFCTERGSDTAVLCAKFEIDWTGGMEVIYERDFRRFQIKYGKFRTDIIHCTATLVLWKQTTIKHYW